MAAIKGNIMIMVFDDGSLTITSNFIPMSIINIMGRALVILSNEIEKAQQAQAVPDKLSPVINFPDKYKKI